MEKKKVSNGFTAARYERAKTLIESGELGENTTKKSRLTYAFYSLDFLPVKPNEDISCRPDVVRFRDRLYLTYAKPYKKIKGERSKITFNVFTNDKFLYGYLKDARMRRFFDYDDFLARCKDSKFLAFLRDCTNLSREAFEAARKNPYCVFYICVDTKKYLDKVGEPTVFNIWEDYGSSGGDGE